MNKLNKLSFFVVSVVSKMSKQHLNWQRPSYSLKQHEPIHRSLLYRGLLAYPVVHTDPPSTHDDVNWSGSLYSPQYI